MMYSSQNGLSDFIKTLDIISSLCEITGLEKHIKYYLKEANRQIQRLGHSPGQLD